MTDVILNLADMSIVRLLIGEQHRTKNPYAKFVFLHVRMIGLFWLRKSFFLNFSLYVRLTSFPLLPSSRHKKRNKTTQNKHQAIMMAMITSEELECADILNDVGICFSEDFGLLETDVNHGFKPISKPTLTSRLMPSTKFVPVSPTPETTPEAPTSTSFEQFDLLAQMPRNVSQFSFQQQQVVPVLPSIMPDPAMTTAPANTIQRAVSDVSITAAIPSQLADAYNNRKRPLQGMLQARPEEQIRRYDHVANLLD